MTITDARATKTAPARPARAWSLPRRRGRILRPTVPPQHAPAPPLRPWVRVTAITVSTLGVLALLFVGYLTVVAGLQQSRQQDILYADFRAELATGTAPAGGPVAEGDPVALLSIPSLGVRQVVVEGSTSRDLMRGPGHESGTALPGQAGTSVILGRRSTFGAPFARIDRLTAGTEIDVTTGEGAFVYHVDGAWRSDASHQAPVAAASRLVLVTGDPALAPHRSLVVTAATDKAGAAGTPTTPLPNGTPLAADTGAATPAYLWAQLLLVVSIGAALAWRRVHRSVVWVGTVPIVIVVVWNLFENLAALLPNTL
jgi:sortase A